MGIIQGCNLIAAYTKATATVAIRATQDAKVFEPIDHILDYKPLLCQLTGFLFLSGCQWVMFALFVRGVTFTMLFG